MPRHPPCALHSLSHTPPTQPRPTATTTTQAATTTHRNQTDDAHHTHTTTPHTQTTHTQARHTQTCLCQRAQPTCVSDAFGRVTRHKEPTHTRHNHNGCMHNKQSDPGTNPGPERCSRPLSRSQTTTPHHPPAPTRRRPDSRDQPKTQTTQPAARFLRTPTVCPHPTTPNTGTQTTPSTATQLHRYQLHSCTARRSAAGSSDADRTGRCRCSTNQTAPAATTRTPPPTTQATPRDRQKLHRHSAGRR